MMNSQGHSHALSLLSECDRLMVLSESDEDYHYVYMHSLVQLQLYFDYATQSDNCNCLEYTCR